MNVVIISNKQVIKIFKCDSINVFITGESTRCCRWTPAGSAPIWLPSEHPREGYIDFYLQ